MFAEVARGVAGEISGGMDGVVLCACVHVACISLILKSKVVLGIQYVCMCKCVGI